MEKYKYESVSEALTLLEYGNSDERNKAIATLYLSNDNKKYYNELWRVFMSDKNYNVRKHALDNCISLKPKKVFEILEYCIKEQDRIMETYFIKKVGNNLQYDQYSKDRNYIFMDNCLLKIAHFIGRHREKYAKR